MGRIEINEKSRQNAENKQTFERLPWFTGLSRNV